MAERSQTLGHHSLYSSMENTTYRLHLTCDLLMSYPRRCPSPVVCNNQITANIKGISLNFSHIPGWASQTLMILPDINQNVLPIKAYLKF